MDNNVTANIAIEYDPEIISKIKESIKESFNKLKSFEKLKTSTNKEKPNFKFYNELKQQFFEISMKLEELNLYIEYNYFISLKDYILYIVHQNSIDSTFGHCNFTVELIDFFMELFKTNINFYKKNQTATDEFKRLQKDFKNIGIIDAYFTVISTNLVEILPKTKCIKFINI